MTVAVGCNLADGVVLGVDSAVTITAQRPGPTGPVQAILKVYNDAEKLFQLYDLPLGLVTYGAASLEKRTIQSYVREFEAEHDRDVVGMDSVQGNANAIWTFLHAKYLSALQQMGVDISQVSPEDRPPLGLLLGGFGHNEYLSELWELSIQADDVASGVQCRRDRGVFGSTWKGTTHGIARFHKGFAFEALDRVVQAVLTHFGNQMNPTLQQDISQIVKGTEYQIPFDGMPLQEGVQYVRFLLDIMINQTRFVVGAPTCGGRPRIAVISKDGGFQWVTETPYQDY
jgi:hypothetical protein